MKKIFTTCLIILSAANLFAQRGFYLTPTVGAGIGKITFRKGYAGGLDKISGFTYKANVGVGYQFGRLGVESGLGYTSLAYGYDNILFEDDFDKVTGKAIYTPYKVMGRFNYITLPVYVTYNIPVNRHLSIKPQAGIGFNYNLNTKAVIEKKVVSNSTTVKIEQKGPREVTICSGNASVLFDYKLNSRLGIVAGPSVSYMYTDIRNFFEHSYINPLLLTLDAGITMKL